MAAVRSGGALLDQMTSDQSGDQQQHVCITAGFTGGALQLSYDRAHERVQRLCARLALGGAVKERETACTRADSQKW